MIDADWYISWSMWEHCNNVLHNEMTPQKTAELENLRTRIRNQFTLGQDGLLPVDRPHLQDKERILQLPLSHARLWVNQLRLARQAFDTKEAADLVALQQSLRKSRQFMSRWLAGKTNAPARAIAAHARIQPANPQEEEQ